MKAEIPQFLLDMSERMHTQDNRATAHPIWIVQVEEYDLIDPSFYDTDAYEVINDCDHHDSRRFTRKEFDPAKVEKGYTAYPLKRRWEPKAYFLTEQGANDYIKSNAHNLRNPRTYVDSMYRCEEMIELRDWIMSLNPPKVMRKDLIEHLNSDTITHKEWKKIVSEVEELVEEMWLFIVEYAKVDLSWWAFSNDNYDGGGNGSSGGSFDPIEYKTFISMTGEFRFPFDSVFEDGIPTDLLWNPRWKTSIMQTLDSERKKQ